MKTVAIVGVGLIGASFGLAIREAGFAGTILGVSSTPAIEAGLAAGAISARATLKDAADHADLIYLAQPVDRILETLAWLGPMARKETLVTDAGSTKVAIVQQAATHLRHAQFVGGHPMAGKETRGAQSADAALFQNRPYVVTSAMDAVPRYFVDMLDAIGAEVMEMTPEEHDKTVALTSHLPQLISTALAAFLEQQTNPHIERVFGSGLLDMTRLALSPPDLWTSIIGTNKANVSQALKFYAEALLELGSKLEAGSLASDFNDAAQFSSCLRKPRY